MKSTRTAVFATAVLVALVAGAEQSDPIDTAKLSGDIAKSEAFARLTPEQLAARKSEVLHALLDLALVPPEVNVKPDRRHSFAELDFVMSAGMTRTDKGRLFAVWHGGEDGPKSFLVGTWSDDGGKTWADTRFTVGGDRPVLWLGEGPVYVSEIMGNVWFAPDGTLRLYVHQSVNMFDSRGALFEFVCRNPDDANPAWSRGRMIGWGGTHNHPIVLKDGTWLLPNNFEDFSWHGEYYPELVRQRGCGILASKDCGRTWTPRGYVRPKGETHYTEHSLIDFGEGRLRMYLRTGKGLMVSDSADEGMTWSEPRYDDNIRQAVSRSGTIRLRDGRLVLVKNGDAVGKVTPRPGKGPDDLNGLRNELTVYLSDDLGKSWKGGLVIDERDHVAYPDIFEGQDGFIYMCYDHSRNSKKDEYLFAKVKPEDVLAKRLVSSGSSLKNVIFSETAGRSHRRTFH